ncbi:hypothetical protein MKX08_003317 [Trichoderma sp. CBMAI-0020]|nr:hypothetical protein MKX08_003317 [Trichoderma sp. CBMAI-0020]
MKKILSRLRSKKKTGIPDSRVTKQTQECQQGIDANKPLDGSDGPNEGTNRPNPPLLTENTPIRELWKVAYEKLQEEDGVLIKSYEIGLRKSFPDSLIQNPSFNANKRDEMEAILRIKMAEINKNASGVARVDDFRQLFFKVVDSANDYISSAASANPYTSIAWTGVSLILPLLLNPSEQREALAKGLDYITCLITQSRMREELYAECYESETGNRENFRQSHGQYKTALEKLYRQILRFQATVYCYYTNLSALRFAQDSIKWHSWEQLVDELRDQESNFAVIEEKWRDMQRYEERLAAEKLQQSTLNTLSAQLSASQKALENATEEEYEGLLRWLCDVDPYSMYGAARDRHEAGTNEWLLDSKAFKLWQTEQKSLLWLHGKAGSGKSILTSSVIKYLRDQYISKSSPSTALAYFYFSFSDLQKQKVDGMLTSLVKQICSQLYKEFLFVQRFREHKRRGERPDTQTLEEMLLTSTSGFSNVYVVIDALDECPLLNDQRENLLKSLGRILGNAPNNLHVFLTSRKEQDIDKKLRSFLLPPSRLEIDLLVISATLKRDIGHYIDQRLATDYFSSWPQIIKEEVKQSLMEKADCMYQYVRLQFELLQKLSSTPQIRKALQDLPIGLDATYDRILQSIDSHFHRQVLGSLKWLAFSRRPLSVQELSEIFTIFTTSPSGDAFDEQERPFSCTDILKYFSSLIVTQRDEPKESDPSKFTVRLVHFSLKEYLTSARVLESSASVFWFNEVDSHLSIVRSCIVYLKRLASQYAKGVYLRPADHSYHLAGYVGNYWMVHLEEILHESPEIAQEALPLLAANSQSLLTLLRLGSHSLGRESEQNLLSRPYCYTALLGLHRLTQLLISEGVGKYVTQHDLGRALSTAADQGNTDMMQLLLKAGAIVDVSGTCGTSLETAMRQGHLHVVELLEKHQAKAGHPSNKGIPVLSDKEAMMYLLDRGADINMQREYVGTLLHEAVFNGNQALFECLLERGADVNAVHERAGTPLQEASLLRKAHATLFVEMLLERGADPNARGGRFETALQAACAVLSPGTLSGSVPRSTKLKSKIAGDDGTSIIVQNIRLLIDHGADVKIQGGECGTALHALAGSAEPETGELIELLLDKGAKIDQLSEAGWGTALHVACHEGMIETVALLLDHGADVNAAGGTFGTPLQAAVTSSWSCERNRNYSHDKPYLFSPTRERELMLEIVHLLLDRGAEIKQRGGKYATVLQAACVNPDVDVELLRLLLQHGADITAEGGLYGTILAAACSNPRMDLESVHLLLDSGVDVNAEGGLYGTALIAACSRGHVELVKLLISRGADVNAKSPRGQTALMKACSQLSREATKPLVEVLLKGGADVNANDQDGQTPLTRACQCGDFDLVKLLIDHGADILRQDCAAWHKAAQRLRWVDGQKDMLAILELFYACHMDINHLHKENGTALNTIIQDWYLGDDCKLHPSIGWLLDHGADINIVGGDLGCPLQAACADTRKLWTIKDIDMMSGKTKLLLEHCPDIDVNAQGGRFGSALQAAAFSGQAESVRLLLSKQANVHAAGGKYGSALNAAIIGGYWNIVELLLKAGATPDRHLQQQPDEEWLGKIREEHEDGTVERYMKFWEVQANLPSNS